MAPSSHAKRMLTISLATMLVAALAPLALAEPPEELRPIALRGTLTWYSGPHTCFVDMFIDLVPERATGPDRWLASLTYNHQLQIGACAWEPGWDFYLLKGNKKTGWKPESTYGPSIGPYGDGSAIFVSYGWPASGYLKDALAPQPSNDPLPGDAVMSLTGIVQWPGLWGNVCSAVVHIDVVSDPSSGPDRFLASATWAADYHPFGRMMCGDGPNGIGWAYLPLSGNREKGWTSAPESLALVIGPYGDGMSIPATFLGAKGSLIDALAPAR